ncbi:MAG: LamG-like jellyroll fold domain-containing protein [Vicinamibacterales bacterium]
MATSFASGAHYSRTAGTFPAEESFSVALWCRWAAYTTFRSVFDYSDGNGNQANAFTLYLDGSGFRCYDARGGSASDDQMFGSGTIAANTWAFVAAAVSTLGVTWYYAKEGDVALSTGGSVNAGTRSAFTTLLLGRDISGTPWDGGDIVAAKTWNAELTSVEFLAEYLKLHAQRTANLHEVHELYTPGTTDESGNSRTLTANGTPGTASGNPPFTDLGGGGASRPPFSRRRQLFVPSFRRAA